MTLTEKQQELIEGLNLIADPHERLSVVVAQGSAMTLPAIDKTEANRVLGCVSRVWLVGNPQGVLCQFRGDGDSPLVKGLVALLCNLYSGVEASEVENIEPEVWERCGLARLLSPTRLNGLKAVRARIRELAAQIKDAAPPI